MTRTKGGFITKNITKIIKFTKGFYSSQSRLFKTANQEYMRSLRYSYIDRKHKKSDIKKIWIKQINITSKLNLLNYNSLINNFKRKNVLLNKKMLAKICLADSNVIQKILKEKE